MGGPAQMVGPCSSSPSSMEALRIYQVWKAVPSSGLDPRRRSEAFVFSKRSDKRTTEEDERDGL